MNEKKTASVIDIGVSGNILTCGINGGNTRACETTRLSWRSRVPQMPFTLEFFRLGLENDGDTDVAHLRGWPFEEDAPPGGVVGPTTEFTGTLRREEKLAVYEYVIAIGNLRLDPIIIVDR